MTEYYLAPREPYYRIRVRELEQKHNAKYMGPWHHADFDEPLDVFYVSKPKKVGERLAEKYVGVAVEDGVIYCFAVDEIFNRPIVGVEADNGEVCVSRFEEDHVISSDETVWVDGGPDTIQTNKPDRQVQVHVVNDRFEFEPLGLLEFEAKRDLSNAFFKIFQWP